MFIVTYEMRTGLSARIFLTLEEAKLYREKMQKHGRRKDAGEVVIYKIENVD